MLKILRDTPVLSLFLRRQLRLWAYRLWSLPPLRGLALLLIRAHTRLEWDADLGRVTNHTEANRFIGPGYDYRPGWGI